MLDWSNITSSTFEELVFDYANIQEPCYTWIKTPPSNDGNKDVFTQSSQTIFSSNIDTQYWLEAKYNENCGALSKGQLDPTLVSGYLAGNVQIILFVTNGRFTENYLNRAERFYNIPNHRIVHFVDGIELEQWLFRNPNILNKYFTNVNMPLSNENIHIKYCYFTDVQNLRKGIPSPLMLLNKNNIYYLYIRISIFSSSIYSFQIVNNEIIIVDREKLYLKEGIHQLCFKVKSINTCKNKNVIILIKRENNIEYKHQLETRITIYDLFVPILRHPSQEYVINSLFALLKYPNDNCSFIAITGKGGIGKSFILKELEVDLPEYYLYQYIQFSAKKNAKKLCSLIMELCFPGFSSENDVIFENILTKSINSSSLIRILNRILIGVSDLSTALEVTEEIITYREDENILLENYSSQHQLFFLEDVHKLSQNETILFAKIIKELSNIGRNITIVVTSRLQNEMSPHLHNLIKDCFNIFELSPLEPESVNMSINSNIDSSIILDDSIVDSLATSTLLLSNFIVKLHEIKAASNNNLRLNILANKIAHEESINLISGINIKKYKPFYQLLDLIFILHDGLEYDFALQIANEIDILKLHFDRIVKIDNQRLYPFHDLIHEAYIKYRGEKICIGFGEVVNNLIKFRNNESNMELDCILLNCGIKYFYLAHHKVIDGISELIKKQNYYAALNLTRSLISNKYLNSRSIPKYSIQCVFFYYAICLAHCSDTGNAITYFEKAYLLGKYDIEDVNCLCLAYASKAEVINEKFWALQVQSLPDEINEFIKMLEEKASIDKFATNENYIDAYLNALNRNMVFNYLCDNIQIADRCLEKCEEQCLLNHKLNHLGYAYMDYARASYIINIHNSLKFLYQAKYYFEQSVYETRRKLIVECDIAYLETIFSPQNIEVLIEQVEKLKDNGYYSEYYKGLLKISACLLINNQKEWASDFLNSFLKKKYNEDARCCGLLSNLQSAYYLLSNDISQAIHYSSIQQEYFANIGTSYKIVSENNLKLLHSLQTNKFTPKINWNFKEESNVNIFYIETRIW